MVLAKTFELRLREPLAAHLDYFIILRILLGYCCVRQIALKRASAEHSLTLNQKLC